MVQRSTDVIACVGSRRSCREAITTAMETPRLSADYVSDTPVTTTAVSPRTALELRQASVSLEYSLVCFANHSLHCSPSWLQSLSGSTPSSSACWVIGTLLRIFLLLLSSRLLSGLSTTRRMLMLTPWCWRAKVSRPKSDSQASRPSTGPPKFRTVVCRLSPDVCDP